jgi:hypothetical protein
MLTVYVLCVHFYIAFQLTTQGKSWFMKAEDDQEETIAAWVSAIRGVLARYATTTHCICFSSAYAPKPMKSSFSGYRFAPACAACRRLVCVVWVYRLAQDTATPESHEPEFFHHNVAGRDFHLDSRYTDLK